MVSGSAPAEPCPPRPPRPLLAGAGEGANGRTLRRRAPSAYWTYATRRPSGEAAGHRSCCSVLVRRRSAPAESRTQMRAASPRPRTNATAPSRPTVGSASGRAPLVRRWTVPERIASLKMLAPPSRLETKAIDWPSGDQAGWRSHSSPLVSRVQRRPPASRDHGTVSSTKSGCQRKTSRQNTCP